MAEEVKKGMPPALATALSTLGGLLVPVLQDIVSGGDFSDLLANPKKLVAAVLSGFLMRIAFKVKERGTDPAPAPPKPVNEPKENPNG